MADEETAVREAQRQAEADEAGRCAREAGGGEAAPDPEVNSSPPSYNPSWNK
jgi:hypothetical protein